MNVRTGLLVTVFAAWVSAADPSSVAPTVPGARVETYKNIASAELRMFIFDPPGHTASDKSPAIVFFFGGGWTSGTPRQFEQQCRYLASRGVVAMAADYRVSSRHTIDKPADCIRDAKSAIRWARKNAARLGIDPDRIAAAGGSAGGHIAACTGILQGLDESGEDVSISSVPNAMALFNPAVALPNREGKPAPFGVSLDRSLWPAYHVRHGTPPTIMFFGTADELLPPAREMAAKFKEFGDRCELVTYEGQRHGFFNFRPGPTPSPMFLDTLRRTDLFLASLGWIKGEPTLDGFKWDVAR